jgi:hypothetical protein
MTGLSAGHQIVVNERRREEKRGHMKYTRAFNILNHLYTLHISLHFLFLDT